MNEMNEKKTIFSGIQPSGVITLGNYLGALSNWVTLQDEYHCYYCIVDLHAITVPQVASELRKNALLLLSQYLAAGIDPEKSTIFIQSHVPAHSELAWILNSITYMGELSRMTQFKEKSTKNKSESISAGLFNYPILMAADILLYNAHLVPVGQDQKQHLELARTLAGRFNTTYSDTFHIPDGYIPKVAARIMSLQDPLRKMSKSDENPNSFISIMDENDNIVRKIKRSVTDSDGVIRYREDQPGIKNLIEIYSVLEGISPDEIVKRYENKGYGIFKSDVADVIVQGIAPVRDEAKRIMEDRAYLEMIYSQGAEKANRVANKMLSKVQKKVGFLPKK